MAQSFDPKWNEYTVAAASARYTAPITSYQGGGQNPSAERISALMARLPEPARGGMTATQKVHWRQNILGVGAIGLSAGLIYLCRNLYPRNLRYGLMALAALPGVAGGIYLFWDRFNYLDLDKKSVRAEVRQKAATLSFTEFVDYVTNRKIVRSAGCGAGNTHLTPDDLVRYRLWTGASDQKQTKLHGLATAYVASREAYREDEKGIESLFSGETAQIKARAARDKVRASQARQHSNWQADRGAHNVQHGGIIRKGVGGVQLYDAYRGRKAANELEEAATAEHDYRIAPYEQKREDSHAHVKSAKETVFAYFNPEAAQIGV